MILKIILIIYATNYCEVKQVVTRVYFYSKNGKTEIQNGGSKCKREAPESIGSTSITYLIVTMVK